MQLHHILPRYFRYIIDKSSDVGAMIPRKLHQDYHRHVSRGMQRTLGCPPMNAGETKWRRWVTERSGRYGGDAEAVRSEVKRSLQSLTDQWGSKNGILGLGEVLRGLLQ